MNILNLFRLITVLALSLQFSMASAAALYPIDKAAILLGSQFDIKIEFDGTYLPEEFVVQLSGALISKLVRQQPTFILNESGKGSSLIYRDVQLNQTGKYVLMAKSAQQTLQVSWDVYASGPRKVKNVILFIGDGMTIANRTSARVFSKGISERRYRGKLSFDDMPNTALIGTSGFDSLITDSANSMSAYTTGHKTAVNAIGVYVSRASDNLSHPKVETIAELIKRKTKMSVSIVSDAELQDATPGAMVAHTRRRADKAYIADQLLVQVERR